MTGRVSLISARTGAHFMRLRAVALALRRAPLQFTHLLDWPLAPGAEPPINTFFPSRYSTKTPTHLLSPLLAWYAKTLISVPIGKLVFVIPFLKRLVGGPPSIPQLTTLPSAPFTSIQIQAWGLINSTLVT